MTDKKEELAYGERISLAPGALTAPIPPAIVTVGDREEYNMLTVAWTGILATQPPKTYISVRPSRHSYGMLKKSGEFVINLPSAKIAREVDFVGIYTGAKMNKFEKTGLTPIKSKAVLPPTVAECPIALECRVCEVIPMGSHDVFVADIVSVSCRGDIIDSDGKMRYERADLLAYMHGEYYSIGERLGRFGFSTDKAKPESKGKPSTKTQKSAEAKAPSPKKADQADPKEIKRPAAEIKATNEKKPFYLAVAGMGKNKSRRGRGK